MEVPGAASAPCGTLVTAEAVVQTRFIVYSRAWADFLTRKLKKKISSRLEVTERPFPATCGVGLLCFGGRCGGERRCLQHDQALDDRLDALALREGQPGFLPRIHESEIATLVPHLSVASP